MHLNWTAPAEEQPFSALSLELFSEAGETVLKCRGSLDLLVAPLLRAALDVAVGLNAEQVIVDLSAVRFFDCSAIGAFVAARSTLASSGSSFSLRGPSAFGRRILGLVGLDDLVEPAVDLTVPIVAETAAVSLRDASHDRYVLEQAKGLLAQRFGASIDEALDILRDLAVQKRQTMVTAAEQLFERGFVSEGPLPPPALGDPSVESGADRA